jgi:hypothetical protein
MKVTIMYQNTRETYIYTYNCFTIAKSYANETEVHGTQKRKSFLDTQLNSLDIIRFNSAKVQKKTDYQA